MEQQYVSTPLMLVRGAKIKIAKDSFEIGEKLPVGHQTPFHWCNATRKSDGALVWLQLLFNQFENGQVTEFRQAWGKRAIDLAECAIAPTSVTFAVSHNLWAIGVIEPFRREIPRNLPPQSIATALFTALSSIHAAGQCIGGLHDEGVGFRNGLTFCDLSLAPLIQYADDRHLVPLRQKDFHVSYEVLDSRTPTRWGDIVALSSWLTSRYSELASNRELVAVTSGARFAEQWDAATLASMFLIAKAADTTTSTGGDPGLLLVPSLAGKANQPPASVEDDPPTSSFEEAVSATWESGAANAPTQKPPLANSSLNATQASPGSAQVYAASDRDIPVVLVVLRGITAAAIILFTGWVLSSWFVNGVVHPRMKALQTEELSPKERAARDEFEKRLKRAGGLSQ